MISAIRISVLMLLVWTVLLGFAYPLAVTGVGQLVWPAQAGGSLISKGNEVVGSALIGQPFTSDRYFWSRASATAPAGYNAAASSGSNAGPLNPALKENVAARIETLRKADPTIQTVPIDLVTASGSGLDPHISPEAAAVQVVRVAKARGRTVEDIQQLVSRYTEGRQLGFLGEPRVNVLLLNLALDRNEKATVAAHGHLLPNRAVFDDERDRRLEAEAAAARLRAAVPAEPHRTVGVLTHAHAHQLPSRAILPSN